MNMEQWHDKERTIFRCQFVRCLDVLHCPCEISMRQWNCLWPSCCAASMEDQCDIVRLCLLHLLIALGSKLSCTLHVQDDFATIPIALCNGSIVLPCSTNSS